MARNVEPGACGVGRWFEISFVVLLENAQESDDVFLDGAHVELWREIEQVEKLAGSFQIDLFPARIKGPGSGDLFPHQQHPNNATALTLLIRTAQEPRAFSGTLRRVLREGAPDIRVRFTTMDALLHENLAAPRFRTLLLAIFAGLAVCLAMAGVYAVLAYPIWSPLKFAGRGASRWLRLAKTSPEPKPR